MSLTSTRGHTVPGLAGWTAYALGIALSAIAINVFVLLLHEGMHHALFARSVANRWMSVLFG